MKYNPNFIRNFHFLSRNEKTIMPSHLIFFDTETELIDNVQKLKLGWVFYARYEKGKISREKKYFFTEIKEFWDILKKYNYKNSKIFIFAHNISFDFLVVGGSMELQKHNLYIDSSFIDGGNFILSVKEKDKINEKNHYYGTNYIFLDTMNYIKRSLSFIGDMIGLKKMDIDFNKCSFEELATYCYRDTEILQKFIISWIEFLYNNNLGNFKYTIASQSFTTYRHKFMPYEIGIHNNINAIELERKSYRGGRTEVFKFGKEYAYIYDVNSMYPYIMKVNKFPSKIIGWYKGGNKKSIINALNKGYGIIADMNIKTETNAFGIKKDRLIFPIGSFNCCLCSPEIEFLLSDNTSEILGVNSYCLYQMDYIFSDYIDFFYSKRIEAKKSGDMLQSEIFKLFMNSLYGKFGQKMKVYKEIGTYDINQEIDRIEHIYNTETKEYKLVKWFGGKITIDNGYTEAFNSFVAIPSFVTAYARIYLFNLMLISGLDNVLYCDTDSLFLSKKGKDNLIKSDYISDNELGKLKLEKKGYANIFNCKDYNFNKERTIKGVPKTAKVTGKNQFNYNQFIKIKTALRKGIIEGVGINNIDKEISQEYKKGIVKNNKSYPFRLDL